MRAKRNTKKMEITMELRHIPTLTGEEGRRFIYNAEHPKKASVRERKRIMCLYKQANQVRDGIKVSKR